MLFCGGARGGRWDKLRGMQRFFSERPSRPWFLGVVHLRALPGAPGSEGAGTMAEVVEHSTSKLTPDDPGKEGYER